MIGEAALKDFRSSLGGDVLTPADEAYDIVRRVFNAMIDRRPALIVRCAVAADVVRCVQFAQANELEISVRGGGHSVSGKAVSEGGLMIDFSRMKSLQVDPNRQTARAEPGLTLGEFDRETQVFGLATPLGVVSMTGIAGLTLGGGIGWLSGRHGLACDNLLSVEIATADGRLLTASPAENADLFWGVRGGGGNFGIVTSFEYRLHSVGPVLAGIVLHPLAKAKEVLRFYHRFSSECPDEVSTVAALLTSPEGVPVVALGACDSGPLDAAEKTLKPLRSFATPIADLITPMSYVQCQSMLDGSYPPGQRHYWKASFLRNLEDAAIEVITGFAATMPTPQTSIGFQQMHGAAARVGGSETAFAHRQEQYDFGGFAIWTDPSGDEKAIRWARDLHEAMQPYLERSVYVNDLGDEGVDRVRAAYGANYDRLVALKNKYDPTNVFGLNQNIAPTSGQARLPTS